MIKNQPQKAFTLVETLVAITVLITAIVGPLYAVHKSLVASYTARDTLTATALAQEGIEYVRSVRDGNYLANPGNPNNWLSGLSSCMITGVEGPSDYGCGPDPITRTVEVCGKPTTAAPAGCTPLKLDSSYRYRQGATGTVTRFARRVTITPVPSSSSEVVVTTTVAWSTLHIAYTVVVTEHLYNWQYGNQAP
jgi:type II secretory pathway pseudopilin PulG